MISSIGYYRRGMGYLSAPHDYCRSAPNGEGCRLVFVWGTSRDTWPIDDL